MMILYVVVLTIEVVLLCLFVPSAAGGSIAGERERQTLDILLSSRMTVREIVTGKLLSCISMAMLLVVTSIPILAVTSMYGGMQLGLLYQSAAYVGFFIRCFVLLPFQKDNLCFYIGLWFADCFDNRNRFAGSSP